MNLGNLLLRQGNHAAAIREYQAAMDHIPAAEPLLRARLLQSIGIAFLESQMLQAGPPTSNPADILAICSKNLGVPGSRLEQGPRACRAFKFQGFSANKVCIQGSQNGVKAEGIQSLLKDCMQGRLLSWGSALQDAMLSFEASMDEAPTSQAAFNLLICTFVLGHPDRCKQSYTRLVQVGLRKQQMQPKNAVCARLFWAWPPYQCLRSWCCRRAVQTKQPAAARIGAGALWMTQWTACPQTQQRRSLPRTQGKHLRQCQQKPLSRTHVAPATSCLRLQ